MDAAVTEFAQKGLHGTSTEDIARRVGISQPYIFQLFSTKMDLFIAAGNRVYERIHVAFEKAAESATSQGMSRLDAMVEAYQELLHSRDDLLMLLQTLSACDDPDIQAAVRDHFKQIYAYMQELAQIDDAETSAFFAQGVLLNVAVALDLPLLLGCGDWESFKQPHHPARRNAIDEVRAVSRR